MDIQQKCGDSAAVFWETAGCSVLRNTQLRCWQATARRPDMACCLCLCGRKPRRLSIFKWLQNDQNYFTNWENYLKFKSQHPSIKFLKHSQTLIVYCLVAFALTTMAEVGPMLLPTKPAKSWCKAPSPPCLAGGSLFCQHPRAHCYQLCPNLLEGSHSLA